MTLAHKFQHHRSDRPPDLIFGIVISILLHLIVYLGYDNWLRFKPQPKRSSQPIPIEYVEVPPDPKPKQTPPPQKARIAANNSVAGGKPKPEQPVAVRLAPPVVEQGEQREQREQRSKEENSIQNSEAERRAPLIAKLKSQKTDLAPSIPQPQPQPQKTDLAPSIPQPQPQPQPQTTALAKREGVIAPSIPQPQPKPQTTRIKRLIPQPQPQPQKTDLAPSIPQPQAKPQKTDLAPSIPQPQPKPRTTDLAPSIPQPQAKPQKTDLAPTILPRKPLTRQVLPPKSTSSQLATKTTPSVLRRNNSPQNNSRKIKTPPQPSRIGGAASRLGGTISVSRQNFKGYQAALPNSNRFNQGADGIDARRDVDMGSYLMQLQQRVRQQWIPGQTQSSRQTVVYFVVSRSGQVRGLTIARPSGSSVTDSAALGAISRAAPFAPLPMGYPHNSINIRFTFNINVSGQLELRAR